MWVIIPHRAGNRTIPTPTHQEVPAGRGELPIAPSRTPQRKKKTSSIKFWNLYTSFPPFLASGSFLAGWHQQEKALMPQRREFPKLFYFLL
jgi:hypothetical protein